jgi:hypothetical protein
MGGDPPAEGAEKGIGGVLAGLCSHKRERGAESIASHSVSWRKSAGLGSEVSKYSVESKSQFLMLELQKPSLLHIFSRDRVAFRQLEVADRANVAETKNDRDG